MGRLNWRCIAIPATKLDRLRWRSWKTLPQLAGAAHALIVHSTQKAGFSAGADLRELFQRGLTMEKDAALRGVREFLGRIHSVMNTIDAAPLTTIAAVHGVT